MIKAGKRVLALLARSEDGACLLLMVTLLLLLFLQVLGRIMPWGFPWTEELSRYAFVWVVLVGASAAVRTKQHVALTLLRDSVKGSTGIVLRILSVLVSLTFSIFLTILGFRQVGIQYAGENMAYSVALPLWIVWLAIPISFFLFSLWLLTIVGAELRQLRESIHD